MPRKKHRVRPEPPPLVQLVPGVARLVGSLSLLRPLLAAMGIRRLVDDLVSMQRERQDGVSHGQVVEALVANRLISPRPLSRIQEWAEGQGLGVAFGIEPQALNDSRIGRALDALTDGWSAADAGPPPLLEELQTRVTLHFMRRFGIQPRELGYDTTSLYFEGDYDESELVRFGYSRDHRPDLKQIVVGVGATLDGGVAVHGRTYAGNRADTTTTLETLERLKDLMPDTRRVLITTDRGMMTPPTVHALLGAQEPFIATLDATKSHLDVLRAIPPEAFGPSVAREGYLVAESAVEIVDQSDKTAPRAATVRAIAVWAPGKAERDRKARERALSRIQKRLGEIGEKLGQRRYRRLDYARERVEAVFSGELRQYRPLYAIELIGGEEADSVTAMAVAMQMDAYRDRAALDGRYFIITSMPQDYGADQVLEAYKRRDVCEQAMRILKTDLKVRPIFLHKDGRIAALAYLTVFALMVFTLLSALAKRLDLGTTARHIFDLFWTVTFVRIRQFDGRWIDTYLNIDTAQVHVLRALGLPADLPP